MDYSPAAELFNSMTAEQQKTSGVFLCIFLVLLIIAEWKIFTKAGEKGWYSLIPVLREYKICKIFDGSGIKCILLIIPVIDVIYGILLCFRAARSFGKGIGFGFGLLFLPNIFLLILGFGSAEYVGPRGEKH